MIHSRILSPQVSKSNPRPSRFAVKHPITSIHHLNQKLFPSPVIQTGKAYFWSRTTAQVKTPEYTGWWS